MRKLTLLIVVSAALISPAGYDVYGCNVCHSKNPKMVKMHQALGFKDCFKCHAQGLASKPEEKKAQMLTDNRCTPCHKK